METWFSTSNEIEKISESLAKAQGQIDELSKDATAKVKTKSGHEYSYDYLSLPQLTKAIQKPMTENGLSLVFSNEQIGERPVQVGILNHSSGQWIRVSCPIYLAEQTMQAIGSAKTYARRYVIQDLFNIAADADDDGNAAAGNQAQVQTKTGQPMGQKPPVQQTRSGLPNFAPQNMPR